MKKLIVILLLLAAAGGAVWYFFFHNGVAPVKYRVQKIERGDLRIVVSLLRATCVPLPKIAVSIRPGLTVLALTTPKSCIQ